MIDKARRIADDIRDGTEEIRKEADEYTADKAGEETPRTVALRKALRIEREHADLLLDLIDKLSQIIDLGEEKAAISQSLIAKQQEIIRTLEDEADPPTPVGNLPTTRNRKGRR